jgi:hypothetical protein
MEIQRVMRLGIQKESQMEKHWGKHLVIHLGYSMGMHLAQQKERHLGL